MRSTQAELRIDGILASSTTIAPGALDGVPGVYSGARTLIVAAVEVRTSVATGGAK